VKDELERVMSSLMHYPGVHLKGLRKITKTVQSGQLVSRLRFEPGTP
jgi:hypothetical protein